MKIRTRFIIGITVLVLLIWTTVFVAANIFTNIYEEFEALERDIIPDAITISEMGEKAQVIRAWTLVYSLRGNIVIMDKPVKEWVLESMGSLEEGAREHREHGTHIGLEEQKAAEELESKVKQLNSAALEIINFKDQGAEVDELIEKMEESLALVFPPLVRQFEKHEAVHEEKLAEAGEAVYQAESSGKQALFLAAGLITLLGTAIAFTIARSILKPLHALHKGTEIIGQGNLDYRVGTKAKDELGQLSRAFDQMTENLGRTTTSIANLNEEITERKRVERLLQEKNEELDAQNEELQVQSEELMAQQQELMEKTRALEAASQFKSLFLAGMSHELRTPLNAVIGFSQLMLDGALGETNDTQRQCLTDIHNSGQHLLVLINDVLDLTKVEAGKLDMNPERLNLGEAINEVLPTVRPLLDAGNLKLKISIEPGLPAVNADKNRLRQIMLNLLSNAIKFTLPGGKIVVKAVKKDDCCQVSVIDSGIGIPKEDQERIFEAFDQLDTPPEIRKEGTGLGLTITRQFVEMSGGRLWLDSEPGEGSNFTFTLPFADN